MLLDPHSNINASEQGMSIFLSIECRSSLHCAVEEVVLSFGKHKGKQLKQLDDAYLQWMQSTLEDSWNEMASRALQERRKQRAARRTWILLDELKVCSKTKNLQRGRDLHVQSVESGVDSSLYLATALVTMYGECGSMADARQVFDTVSHPDVVLWTALILGYANNGEQNVALELFARMKSGGCLPNSFTFVAALKACIPKNGSAGCLEQGRIIHSQIGCHMSMYVQNTLIDMYAKCGCMADAHQVFDSIEKPDVVAWNIMILGYAENGKGFTALDLFARMVAAQQCTPTSLTFVSALKACTSLAVDESEKGKAECLARGRLVHSQAGFHSDMKVQSALITMYSKCGSMVDARQVFDCIPQPDVVSWNALISGYADNGQGDTALELFQKLKSQGCAPSSLTFVAALKACTSLALDQNGDGLEQGKKIHSQIGYHSSMKVQNTLMDMYAKLGSMDDARQIFESLKHPDVVSWTCLILGYAEAGDGSTALDLFARMRNEGYVPDSLAFVAALKACISLALHQNKAECLVCGEEIHSQIGRHSDMYVQNTLIDMYAKCGKMAKARRVFDNMKHPNVVSWNTLISGYADNENGVTALDCFARMEENGCAANGLTYVAALKACSLLGALECGRKIHKGMVTEPDTFLVSCLVDFYTKCGDLEAARKVFDAYPRTRNIVTWNALLGGYSRLGDSEAVFGMLEEMQDAGLQPDDVTFLCMLVCCNHSGLVDRGKECLNEMLTKSGIAPRVEHYSCLVDMLGRSNKLDEAISLLHGMPWSPDVVTWMTVLGACHKWKNVAIGKLAFASAIELDNTNAAAYVLMAHIYGSRGLWKEQETVLAMSKEHTLAGTSFERWSYSL